MSERVSTGIPELDKILGGGLIKHGLHLIAGLPGAGKTILSAKFLYDGATQHREPGVYACFAETRKMFVRSMLKFGWDFEALSLEGQINILDLSLATDLEIQQALNQIFEAVDQLKARRLVIDSITALASGLKTDFEKRHLIHLIYKFVQKSGTTTIMIADMPWGSKKIGNSVEEFIADGIILMENFFDEKGNLRRRLRVLKMRGGGHGKKTYEYDINEKGIEIKGDLEKS
jgi:circadian clock protein KaiC